MTIKEALARANADDEESLEALCRALLRGGHGPDAARMLSMVAGDIQQRNEKAMALEEAQKREEHERQQRASEVVARARQQRIERDRDRQYREEQERALEDPTRTVRLLQAIQRRHDNEGRTLAVERKVEEETNKVLRKLSTGGA